MNKSALTLAALCLVATTGQVNAEVDGKAVYEASCARCHDSGRMGAPVLDDMSEWTDVGDLVWSDIREQHLDDGLLRDAADDAKKGISEEQMEAATAYMASMLNKK